MRLRAIFLFLCLVAGTPAMADESFWSGYYIGVDLGGYLAEFSRQQGVISPFGGGVAPVPSAALNGMSNGDPSPSITILLGRSFLANHWLLFGFEIEGSYQQARATFSGSHIFQASVGDPTGNGVFYQSGDTVNSAATFDWTGALRARLGYLVTPDLLFYAAAGPTLADVTFTAQHNGAGALAIQSDCQFLPRCFVAVFGTGGDSAANKEGLVPGINLAGGLEYQISANISLRAEYDYSQFSSIRLAAPQAFSQSAPDSFKVGPILQTGRLGLAYHF